MKLTGKTALITGGASGIGRATALKLAREGAQVVVADMNEAGGHETVQQVRDAGGEAAFYRLDVTDFQQVEAAVQFAADTYGGLHIVFNNAGIGANKPFLDHDPETYDRVVKVNQYGVYYGMLAGARKMVELGIKGVIINTASVFGYVASPGTFGYHASKGAVRLMSQSAALDLAPHGIRVVAIGPGAVDTPIIQGYKDAGLDSHMARKQMRGQLIQPESIADGVYLLCLDEAHIINGSTVMLDDGFISFK